MHGVTMKISKPVFHCLDNSGIKSRQTVFCERFNESNIRFELITTGLYEHIQDVTIKKRDNFQRVLINVRTVPTGHRGSTVVKVLCYKSEGRWFDPNWYHRIRH